MADATTFEQEVARLIVEALNLEDVKPESIDPEAALFREGLGLDSIDARNWRSPFPKNTDSSCNPTTSRIPRFSARCARYPGTSNRTARPDASYRCAPFYRPLG